MNANYQPNLFYEEIESKDAKEVRRLKHRINDFVLQINVDERLRNQNATLNNSWNQYITIRKMVYPNE